LIYKYRVYIWNKKNFGRFFLSIFMDFENNDRYIVIDTFEWVTMQEYSIKFGIAYNTVKQWAKRGKLQKRVEPRLNNLILVRIEPAGGNEKKDA
jgi:hypothetical protein